MGTNYIAPTWRMPRNANKDKLSNYSIDFDGADYIDCGDNDMLSFGNGSSDSPFTVSSYIYAEGSSTFPFFDKYPDAGTWALREYRMDIFGTDKVVLIIYDGSASARHEIYSDSLITRDQWQHVVITYDGRGGADAGDGVKIYINSSESTTTIVSYGTYVAMENTTSPVRIGRIGSTYADGKISQCCVFDYVLSENQRTYLNALNNPMAIDGAEPIAYWPLGDNANPIATAGYPNISVGADSVFDFSGTNQNINLGNDASLYPGTSDMSYSFWFKSNSLSGYKTIFGQGAANLNVLNKGDKAVFITTLGDELKIFVGFGGSDWAVDNGSGFNTSNANFVVDQWYHIAFTFDRDGDGVIYINGVPNVTQAVNGSSTSVDIVDTDNSIIGGVDYDFDGQISNFQIWDTDLQLSDAVELYNNGQPLMTGTQPEEANLRAWYKLNQSANWEADTVGEWQIPDAVSAYPQSFDFDGTNPDEINCGTGIGDIIGDSYTGGMGISLWFKTDSTAGAEKGLFIFSGGVDAWGEITAYFAFDNLYKRIKGVLVLAHAFTDITSWHNLLINFLGPSESNQVYLDGAPIESPFTYTDLDLNGETLNIGYTNLTTFDYQGQMSNFQVWNNNLSTPQIAELYNNGVPLPTASVQASNLKAWYKLNNSATFSTNWVVENSAITPNFDKAIDFISSNTQYIDLTNTGFPTGNAARTMSAWIKSDSTGQNNEQGIIKYGTTSTRQLFMMSLAATTGQLRVSTYGDDLTYTTADLRDDAWHHVALTYDGTSIKGYVDGSYVGVETNTLVNTTDNSPAIGNWAGAGFTFNGAISNVILYTETLTDANILTLYNNGTPQITPYGSPFGWWKLDDLITGIQDSGSGGNDGTLVNSPLLTSTDVRSGSGISSGMTEQNLVNNNVSTLNGESSGMDTTNLVQSNISKQIPFSSYSVEFDGLNYFSQVVFPEFELQTISYSVWFKRTGDLTGSVCLITQGASSNKGWTCWLDNTTIRGQFGAGNNNSYNNSTVTSYKTYIPDNTWGNITATCDGIDQKIYVNGILRNTYTDIATIDYSSVVGFRIGERVSGSANFYGEISNPAVWDQVLTADDVLNIYNNGVTQDLNNFRIAPLAWWELGGKYTYWNGTDLVARSTSTGDFDVTGANTVQSQIVGTAPGSEANGTGTNLDLSDLIGDMKDSNLNAYSINMADYADGVTNPANSGRSTLVP